MFSEHHVSVWEHSHRIPFRFIKNGRISRKRKLEPNMFFACSSVFFFTGSPVTCSYMLLSDERRRTWGNCGSTMVISQPPMPAAGVSNSRTILLLVIFCIQNTRSRNLKRDHCAGELWLCVFLAANNAIITAPLCRNVIRRF